MAEFNKFNERKNRSMRSELFAILFLTGCCHSPKALDYDYNKELSKLAIQDSKKYAPEIQVVSSVFWAEKQTKDLNPWQENNIFIVTLKFHKPIVGLIEIQFSGEPSFSNTWKTENRLYCVQSEEIVCLVCNVYKRIPPGRKVYVRICRKDFGHTKPFLCSKEVIKNGYRKTTRGA